MNAQTPPADLLDTDPVCADTTLICFSHLRWDFVLQRPQHLMERFSKARRVFFFEEYIPCDHPLPYLEYHPFEGTSVVSVRPRVPHWWSEADRERALAKLLDLLLNINRVSKPVLWFYTPMMFAFAQHVDAAAVVYDCMDELANFRFAPPRLKTLEDALLERADVVFTGGRSLYESKRHRHDNIHPFPSSVDAAHFAQARAMKPARDGRKRLGFYGVIDERMDLVLLTAVAKARPNWTFVMVGPVVKISQNELPRLPNIEFTGPSSYADLPKHLASWDVALMPFRIDESTRFISPTKTPEYLAAGRPVVSTPIQDVVRQYGNVRGVGIADGPAAFIAACEEALTLAANPAQWLPQVDELLATMSWDQTFRQMDGLIGQAVERNAMPVPRGTISTPAIRPSAHRKPYDVQIIGAGFAGSTLAERFASAGKRVLLVDRRPHIGGNAYDHYDDAGILVHKYGPHLFHTNSREIFTYLSRFTEWRPYEHRVLANVGDKLVPMPINRTTLNMLYGLDLADEAVAEAFLRSRAEPVETIRTSKDVVISQVGEELYRLFFEGYTRKQWGLDPSQLDKAVTSRIPTRATTDDRYFLDQFQAMPLNGYTAMFENMLDHDNIDLELGVDWSELAGDKLAAQTVWTGPVDEFFEYRFGALPYRSLAFKHETLNQRRFQPMAVVNYPSESVPYTRITEYKHITGQVHRQTSVTYEFPQADGDPYYPIPRPENEALYKRYAALAAERRDVLFVGRLATYRYYNMDQVVGQALATFNRWAKRDDGQRAESGAVLA